MEIEEIELPELLLLESYNGNYTDYIDAIYQVFSADFIVNKTSFRGEVLKLKFHPIYQERAYTFYHMTHEGEEEQNRTPDLRRCERMPWARPTIEKVDECQLKIWPQVRNGANRICIWLELIDEPDYFVVIDVRENYKLLWTAFVAQYPHEKRKKLKEYNNWIKSKNRQV